jgi:hypothetical protein
MISLYTFFVSKLKKKTKVPLLSKFLEPPFRERDRKAKNIMGLFGLTGGGVEFPG